MKDVEKKGGNLKTNLEKALVGQVRCFQSQWGVPKSLHEWITRGGGLLILRRAWIAPALYI